MTTKPYALRVVQDTDTALRTLLRDREMAERELASIDAQMLAYRRSYARERGEYMLPSLERLRRELLG
jgi:5-methylcytosine-specific restriction endonuclease McrBC regulatory subunit McrC